MDAVNHIGLMMAFVVYDTLLKSDLYYHSWKDSEHTNKATGVKTKQYHPDDTMKSAAEIAAPIAAELLKHFPGFFIGAVTAEVPNPKPSIESPQMEMVIRVVDYAIKYMKNEMQKSATTMRKLLNDFCLYLLWKSIQDIVDHKPQESFEKFRLYYPQEMQFL